VNRQHQLRDLARLFQRGIEGAAVIHAVDFGNRLDSKELHGVQGGIAVDTPIELTERSTRRDGPLPIWHLVKNLKRILYAVYADVVTNGQKK